MKTYRYLFLGIFLLTFASSPAQQKSAIFIEYIEQYSDLAVDHAKRYKIPASITLAQGILESGAGKSDFVKKCNNHFGIKCHSDWKGKRFYQADDGPNDCFRVYDSADESFEDHSRFLSERKRYAVLFSLEITDYKAWANGLLSCGYATDTAYSRKLIQLIEDYELYQYDGLKQMVNPKVKNKETVNIQVKPFVSPQRSIYKTHGLIYVIAGANDSYLKISNDLDFKVKNLYKYNDVPENYPLHQGDIVYLEKKKKKADPPYYVHVVVVGESMHKIAQQYGIQLSRLYKMNKKKDDYAPEVGDVLKLR